MQNPVTHSLVNHTNGSYHAALFSVLSAQLHTSQRHADGIEGLLSLLQDVPLIGAALQRHAPVVRTRSFWDHVNGEQPLNGASFRLTKSQRFRVLKDVGLVAKDEDEVIPVAVDSDIASQPGPVSSLAQSRCP
jgi:hypothetical protein